MNKYFNLDVPYEGLYKEIGKTIKEHYPQDLHSFEPEYHKYPGIIKARDMIGENIGPPKQKLGSFSKKWNSILRKIKKNSQYEIQGTTYGFAPGFSANLLLDCSSDAKFEWRSRIAFTASMLGPFYSICGVDETFIKKSGDNFGGNYHAINVVTTSPYQEYEKDFLYIKQLIEECFTEYKFVPFETCMKRLKDMHTLMSVSADGTVYNALFNNLFNYYTHYGSRGDAYYGSEKNPNITVTLGPPPPID